jgi:hypothetical protein
VDSVERRTAPDLMAVECCSTLPAVWEIMIASDGYYIGVNFQHLSAYTIGLLDFPHTPSFLWVYLLPFLGGFGNRAAIEQWRDLVSKEGRL